MGKEKQLEIPEAALEDKGAFELLRVWVADRSQQITLRGGVWEDPAAWGVMLADLAQNIVTIHAENDERIDEETFLAKMLEGFDDEIDRVMDEITGYTPQGE
jgi:hypothetical protein